MASEHPVALSEQDTKEAARRLSRIQARFERRFAGAIVRFYEVIDEVGDDSFGVNIIPHTWEATTLHLIKPGDAINFEVDMLARYVARQLEYRA